jgi:hypothetical protein
MITINIISSIHISWINSSFIITRFNRIGICITKLSKNNKFISISFISLFYRICSSLAKWYNCQYAVIPDRVAKNIQCKWFSCWYSLNSEWADGSNGLGFSKPVFQVFVQFSNLLMIYNSSIIILINCLLALYGPEENFIKKSKQRQRQTWSNFFGFNFFF